MKRVYEWYSSLPKRIRDSITVAITTVGFISTILSILGISLGDWEKSSFVIRIAVVLAAFVLIAAVAYLIVMSTEQSKKPCGARHSGPLVV